MTVQEELELSFYKEISVINEGKNVFLVKDIRDNLIYVKKILNIYDKGVLDFFAANSINGIPRIILMFEDDGKLYVIEEFINGITLSEFVKKYGVQSEESATRIICAVCDILVGLHSLRPPLIHRDINPSNILIERDGRITIIDFNIVRRYNEQNSDTRYMGTEKYAAPEQYGFGQSDIRTDIYGIGATLNYLLTGDTLDNKRYTGELSRIINKCVEMNPKDRYNNTTELKSDLMGKYEKIDMKPYKKYTKYLPVGFRNLNPGFMLISGILQLMMISVIINLEIDHDNGAYYTDLQHRIARIGLLIIFIGGVAIGGNYLGIAEKFPGLKQKKYILLKSLLWSVIYILGNFILLVAILAIFT